MSTRTAGDLLPRVLCIDDEPDILNGLRRTLRSRMDLVTAVGGEAGLLAAREQGPFAVVVSDMRMPGMDGATVLSKMGQILPDATRVMLTGHADIESAIRVINNCDIFRFLVKPCSSEQLLEALDRAVEQHRLITAERSLLEDTLRGSISAIVETLAIANPGAFARSNRIRRLVMSLLPGADGESPDGWSIEVAAMLSQLGAVTLPPELADKLDRAVPLTDAEQALVERLPGIADDVLGKIPRLEPVREIIRLQFTRFDASPHRRLPLGARLLKLATDTEHLQARGTSRVEILKTLESGSGAHDPKLIEALESLWAVGGGQGERKIVMDQLEVGMTLSREVYDIRGVLLVGRGQEVSRSLYARLDNLSAKIKEPLYVEGFDEPEGHTNLFP